MAKALKVFVSYARFGQETQRVTAFIAWLRELSNDSIDFVMDTKLKSGEDIHDFEQSLKLYSRVLIIGTTTYKKKVEAGEFGVSREFKIISDLYSKRLVNVFVVVMENEFKEVFPSKDWMPLANYFLGIVHDPKNISIPSYVRIRFLDTAKSLVTDIHATTLAPRRVFSDIDEIRRKLFFEPKHENMAVDMPDDIFNRIFVKTSFYFAVIERNTYLFIGRKGSGKSFLTDYFTRNPISPNTLSVGVHLRDYSLSYIFNMRSAIRLSADLGKALSQRDIFEASWVLFFSSAVVLKLYTYIVSEQENYDLHLIGEIAKFAEISGCVDGPDGFGVYTVAYTRLLNWSIEKVFQFVESGITRMGGEYAQAIADFQTYVEPQKVVSSLIGNRTLVQFQRAAQCLNANFLITVDGFDTKFDNFRSETVHSVYDKGEARKRIMFEIDWLCGLVESTNYLTNKIPETSVPALLDLRLRFLVTLPRDRFSEVIEADRDAYRLRNRHVEIRWTGMELMNLLRKRLEIYYDKQVTKLSLEERLYESLNWVGDVPPVIQFQRNRENINIDLFLYLLRHTFWRPRDILYHAAELISLGEKGKKFKRPVTIKNVRDRVKLTCKSIIRDEFIREFVSIFPKINDCILAFTRAKMEMNYSELYILTSSVDFRLSSGESIIDINQRIEFLYEIGFIGIVFDEITRERRGIRRREIFSFSSDVDIRSDIDEFNKQKARWVIHPIFAEYLELDTSECQFLLYYNIDEIISED